jgi:hypothetical protein
MPRQRSGGAGSAAEVSCTTIGAALARGPILMAENGIRPGKRIGKPNFENQRNTSLVYCLE